MYIVDDFDTCLIDELKLAGHHVDYCPNHTRENILENINLYDTLIIRSKTNIDKEIIDKSINLSVIARGGAGMDGINEEYAINKNIQLINAPEGNSQAVAEHCLGLLLNLLNNISKSYNEIKNGKWNREENRGTELSGKTIGIIGYGNNGTAFANVLKGFNVTVLAYDKYKSNFGNQFVKESTMQDIFEHADIISFHVPLTHETNNLVNSEFINKFNKKIVVLNISRGKILNQKAILDSLINKKVTAFGSDVLENENLKNYNYEEKEILNQLIQHPKVLITPHIAGWTHESYVKISQVLSNKINLFYGNYKKK